MNQLAEDQTRDLLVLLRRGPHTLAELAGKLGAAGKTIKIYLDEQRHCGLNVCLLGKLYSIERSQPRTADTGLVTEYVSRPDNTFVFGFSSDQHMCSKYERLDVLEDLYYEFAREGVDRVYNAGNWIEGEAEFNKYELLVRGMEGQLEYLAEHYPRRKGVHTYAVAGDDHEGWWSKSMGVNIGRRAEHTMQDAGRDDWHNLGYMEAYVKLVNANSGKSTTMLVTHPGGGSSYAQSYKPQKLIESLEGGNKPAVMLVGHYHKLSCFNARNVWAIMSGTTQDQTSFMRKKSIEAHVGGGILTLGQDPATGAIVRCVPDFRRYFDKGYYTNNRWSHSGAVQHTRRV